ncbi:uncharacterized protein BT62DRAFT_932616 [Guyanagaster necrorhizus]|uniref:Uncharacterized protein n=1 Tax=Guyanagaster necrorhizus TaxID=856835 RepID=A0A9P8AT49_9AGAR|nr:uncharacterized protein BT62DRAFT_932616 [Guyanagaster necrorhizus MCA 3950]KAG7445522.1 hypothetical protein BT62DRAFT_932616 [Guyanagaster necrorhizus MCA 3950]
MRKSNPKGEHRSPKRFGQKALNKDLVLRTWSGAILDEKKLPKDWTEVNGVLVGITL